MKLVMEPREMVCRRCRRELSVVEMTGEEIANSLCKTVMCACGNKLLSIMVHKTNRKTDDKPRNN